MRSRCGQGRAHPRRARPRARALSGPSLTSPLAALSSLATRFALRRCAAVGAGARVFGHVIVRGGGVVRVGRGVLLDASTAPIELHAAAGAELVLGDDVVVFGGASLEAWRSITVGARTRLGPFAKLLDSHFHPLTGPRHAPQDATFVVVEEDCEVGPGCTLTAGAHVGRGSSLVGGTVVTRRFPPGVVLGGVPAAVRGRADGGRS